MTQRDQQPLDIYLGLLTAGITLTLCLWQSFGPVAALVDRFMPDDAFYYMQPARVFVETGQVSFDGENPTNGFHPLWFVINTVVYAVFPGEALPLRVLMILQSLLTAATFGLLAWHAARHLSPMAGAILTAICLISIRRITLGGLETSLLLFCWSVLWVTWPRLITTATFRPQRLLSFGLLAGITILARLDSIFLVGLLTVQLVSRTNQSRIERFRRGAWFIAPIIACVGPYLLLNLLSTGHLQPVSGSVKSWIGAGLRSDIFTQGLTLAEIYKQFFWFLSEPSRYFIAAGLLTPWIAIYLHRRDASAMGHTIRSSWPFAAAASLAWLYYAFSYWGPLAHAAWYYTPHAVLAGFGCAAIGQMISLKLRLPGGAAANLAGMLLLTPLLGWVSWPLLGITGGLVAVVITVQAWLRLKSPQREGWLQAALVLLAACAVGLALRRGVDSASWALVGAVGILLASVRPTLQPQRLALVAAVLIASVGLRSGVTLGERLQSSSPTWNGLLYEGALWARTHLPAEARIWANDAGVLGYFSQRRVTNTDGLINSFGFFEQILQTGQLNEYCGQFDFHIACNTNNQDAYLQQHYPTGFFVELPEALANARFQSPEGERHLIVFTMPPQPVSFQTSTATAPPSFQPKP